MVSPVVHPELPRGDINLLFCPFLPKYKNWIKGTSRTLDPPHNVMTFHAEFQPKENVFKEVFEWNCIAKWTQLMCMCTQIELSAVRGNNFKI